MRKNISNFMIALFKLLLVVITMSCLYPILFLGVFTYEPITTLCQGPEGGNLLGEILIGGIQVLSILVVSFLAGLLFPKDRWIVRPAAIIFVLWFFVNDIIAGIYLSINATGFPLYSFVKSSIVPYIFIIMLTYWLSSPLHRCGGALRGRPKVKASEPSSTNKNSSGIS